MLEIERKFLVTSEDFKIEAHTSTYIAQGYLNSEASRTVRVRLAGDKAYLTVKGKSSNTGMSRLEWEIEIPINDAKTLLTLCESGVIEKRRYFIKSGLHTFEVDEFYGDNQTQWAWYNVPQSFRESHWPEKPNLPVQGLDPNAPKTKFNKIQSFNGIPYAQGEIYYCNWPQVVSKYGNRKMFLTEKWERPYEQTWMSYMFQETIKGNITPAILLLSPTEHDRFDHYDGNLRKES